MQKYLTNLLKVILILQMTLGPVARADSLEFDFGDDGSVVTPGEDREDRSPDGDCVGAGCGDDDGHSGGHNDYDDDGDTHKDDSMDVHRGNDGSRADRGDSRDENNDSPGSPRDPIDDPRNHHFIAKQDSDRRDGVIYLRDSEGNFYYRDAEKSDLYTDKKGNEFVKSGDGAFMLPLNGLKHCAASLDCGSYYGYRYDYWNYSAWPNSLNNSQEASDYYDHIQFAEKLLQLREGIEKAEQQFKNDTGKMKVVETVSDLTGAASDAYVTNPGSKEAQVYQDGARELLETVVDIGISVSPLGWGKDAYELITGTNLVTGKQLSDSERLLAGVGVLLPGVGLGIAGLKIIKSMKNGSKTARNGEKIAEALEALAKEGIARFKDGANKSGIVIIGRDMGSVNSAANTARNAGVDVKTFKGSDKAADRLSKAGQKYPGGHVPYENIPNTEMYKENMKWVDKMKDKDFPIIDLGNRKNLPERSRFYDDEVLKFFNKVNKL